MQTKVRIGDELAAFLESGLAIVVATRDGDMQPDGAVGWAVRVEADRERITLFMHPQAAGEMLRNLTTWPEIAIDLDLPTSHRACQVKGRYLASRPACDDERALVERQMGAFQADLEKIGIPRPMTTGWSIWPCTALEIEVTHLFEQTPGPGTGEPLR